MAALAPQELLLHGLALVAALLYLAVGYRLRRREVPREDRGALRAFVIWWVGLGLLGAIGVLLEVGFDLAALGLTVWRVVIYPFVLLLYVIIGALVYYLVYLYTGSSASLRWITLFYTAQFVLLVWLIESAGPYVGLNEVGEQEVMFANERPPGHPLSVLLSLAILLPPVAAAVAYFALFFRVEDRTLRYRVALISGAFVLWFGFSLAGTLFRAATGQEEAGFAAELTSRLLGILAASLVLMAYHPPGFVQRVLGVGALSGKGATGGA